jgi:hypothetical protein
MLCRDAAYVDTETSNCAGELAPRSVSPASMQKFKKPAMRTRTKAQPMYESSINVDPHERLFRVTGRRSYPWWAGGLFPAGAACQTGRPATPQGATSAAAALRRCPLAQRPWASRSPRSRRGSCASSATAAARSRWSTRRTPGGGAAACATSSPGCVTTAAAGWQGRPSCSPASRASAVGRCAISC